MATDGSIVIGTELKTDKFDKQASELDNKIKKEEQKKIKISAELTNIQEEKAKYEELKREAESYKNTVDKIRNIQQERAVKGLKPLQLTEQAQSIVDRYTLLEGKIYDNANAMSKLTAKENKLLEQQSQINDKVTEYKQKIESIKIQKQKAEVDQLKGSIDKVGSSFSGTVKKAGRLALAIFGIRSAYMMLQRASSELSSYDEQYATNLEYIRFVLAQAVAPILRYIVNLAMQLLTYINAIAQAWFGVNLFANGSVESFQKMKKGASGVGKAVKEIKKQLLGFDEVNVLSSQSDTGTSAGAGGVGAMPEIDLSAWQGKIPDWLQWIIDHKNEILSVLAGIATALLLIKFGMSGIKALGFGLIVAGIVLLIQGIIDFIKDPSWKNFMTILEGIALIVAGIAIVCEAWVVALVAVGVAIVAYIIKNWDKVKEIFSEVGKWFYDKVIEPVKGFFIGLWTTFSTRAIEAWNNIKSVFSTIGNWINDNIIQPVGKFFTNLWEGFKNGATTAWEGIKNVFSTVAEFFRNIFTRAWENVKAVFSTGGKIFDGIKEGIVTAFKNIVNAIIRGINRVIAIPFNAINNVLSRINGIEIMGAKPFSFVHTISVPEIPQLKSGGIINMPNKGTLIGGGSALGGEAGKEGVIPLTDQQAMSELGREIGKNVLINLTNITQMNGRTISRELKQVKSTQEFAFNM